MRLATLTALAILFGDVAQAQPQASARPSGPVQQRIAPGLAHYTDEILYGAVWSGPGLSQRDRSLVVISVLIATNKPAQLQGHLGRALSNGVTPVEASGVLTHLALYAGWPNAVTALAVYDEVYTARQVDLAELKAAIPELPAHASDAERTQAMTQRLGGVAPAFARLTKEVIVHDLYRSLEMVVSSELSAYRAERPPKMRRSPPRRSRRDSEHWRSRRIQLEVLCDLLARSVAGQRRRRLTSSAARVLLVSAK